MNYAHISTFEPVNSRDVTRWMEENGQQDLSGSPYCQVRYSEPPAVDDYEQLTERYELHEDGVYDRVYDVVPISVEAAAAMKKEELAAARWDAQGSGIEYAGFNIDTGNDTALYVDTALKKMETDPGLTLQWKTKSGGFATLNQAAVQAIGDLIFAHVQWCFTNESVRVAEVDQIAQNPLLTPAQKVLQIKSVTWP